MLFHPDAPILISHNVCFHGFIEDTASKPRNDMLMVMARRQILLDEESEHILVDLAPEYGGNLDRAINGMIQAYGSLESLAELSEAAQGDALAAQRDRAERGFREGQFTTWDDVKRTNGL